MVTNLGWWLKEWYLKYKRQRWDFCEEVTPCHYSRQLNAAVKFVKLWMSNPFSESRDPSYDGSPKWLECPRIDQGGRPCWCAGYTPGKVANRSIKDQFAWLHLWPCLVPSWFGDSRTIWDCCWPWGISILWERPTHDSSRGKGGMKMKEFDNIFLILQIAKTGPSDVQKF